MPSAYATQEAPRWCVEQPSISSEIPSESIAIDPAAISANPAVTMTRVVPTAPDTPAARANGTVRPSDMPMTVSRSVPCR